MAGEVDDWYNRDVLIGLALIRPHMIQIIAGIDPTYHANWDLDFIMTANSCQLCTWYMQHMVMMGWQA